MNDELPEPLNRVPSPTVPRGLRERTLAAVNRELAVRRKPRWERVLELSVAAVFVVGLGLNSHLITGIAKARRQPMPELTQERQLVQEAASQSFETQYAKYLAQLADKLPG